MGEALGILVLIVLAGFAFGDLLSLGLLWSERNKPEEPAPASHDPLYKRAMVACQFGGDSTNLPKEGKVEINGVSWGARANAPDSRFDIGDAVRVVSRDGLTLLVETMNVSD